MRRFVSDKRSPNVKFSSAVSTFIPGFGVSYQLQDRSKTKELRLVKDVLMLLLTNLVIPKSDLVFKLKVTYWAFRRLMADSQMILEFICVTEQLMTL